jgi:hypothetical protein
MRLLIKLFSFIILATVCAVGSLIISPFSAIVYAFRETFLVDIKPKVEKTEEKEEGKEDGR